MIIAIVIALIIFFALFGSAEIRANIWGKVLGFGLVICILAMIGSCV